MSDRRRLAPEPSASSAPFWEAAADRRLVLQWCTACDRPVHRPRERCPRCLGADLVWRSATGLGTVYAVTVVAPGFPSGPPGSGPYAVALIDLDEGVRMMSNVAADDPASVAIGDRVRVAWEPLDDGRHLPVFEPTEAAPPDAP